MNIAELIIEYVQIHLWIGLAAAAVFIVFGIERVEPNCKGSLAFRPLLIPGLSLLWPLVLWRWWALETGRGADQ